MFDKDVRGICRSVVKLSKDGGELVVRVGGGGSDIKAIVKSEKTKKVRVRVSISA